MSSALISDIKTHVIDPNLSGENFRLLAREFGFDITQNFLKSERQELIEGIIGKLLKQTEDYLKITPGIDPERILQPTVKAEISRVIEEKIMQTCHLSKNSYSGYSTDSTFWPWV